MAKGPTGRGIVGDAVKLLKGADRSRGLRAAFLAAIELSFCALAKTTAAAERAERLEARYMAEVKRWPVEDVRGIFPQVFALSLQAERMDFWGALAGELEALDANLGQFFTPYEVCRLMSAITGDSVTELLASADKPYFTACEPAAGSGAMILALADVVREAGYDPATTMFVQATDLSDVAYRMCFLSLAAAGIPAVVHHGNSLSNEVFDTSLTPACRVFVARHGWPRSRPEKPIPRNRVRGQPTQPGGR